MGNWSRDFKKIGIISALFSLIFVVGYTQIYSSVDALQPTDVDTECREGHVLVFRINSNNYVCVSPNTAEKWEQWGIGERIESVSAEPTEESTLVKIDFEKEKSESMEPQFPIGIIGEYPIPDENDRVM